MSAPASGSARTLLVALTLLTGVAPATAVEPILQSASRTHLGDLDGMLARRETRALVAHGRTDYEVVRGRQVGLVHDVLDGLERRLNADHAPARRTTRKGRMARLPIRVTVIAVPYDQLYRKLEAGYGDLVASPMLVTQAAARRVDFPHPFYDEARMVVITRHGDVLGEGIEAVAGRRIHVRRSSGFHQALPAINHRLAAEGRPPAVLMAADEHLSDDELMEMVNAGLIEATVSYRFRARLWSRIFEGIQVNEHNVLLDEGHIAWAVRKDSPRLRAYLDEFIARERAGILARARNVFGTTRFARNALGVEGRARFDQPVALFRRYGERYDLDHLLLMAQGYQESKLDQNARSRVGAVGIMQVMPQTGAQLKVGDVHRLEPNIHAGAKYLSILRTRYFDDPGIDPVNQIYLAFAAYNAGPGNIRRMQDKARQRGLDPNVWFDNVELVALEHIGRQTVEYVSNIHKYYLAYRLYLDSIRGGGT
jgi:membrane-bound lytic murein transglycosylase MltF